MRLLLACTILILVACGDKVPQSEAARNIGKQPKQTVDSVASKLGNAMQQGQGSERLRESDSKQ